MSSVPLVPGDLAQRLEEAGPAARCPCCPHTGSTMIAASSSPCSATARSTRGEVVEGRRRGCRRRCPRAPRGEPGMPSVATPEPAATRKRVGVAVVAAVELEDLVAPGEAAGQPHGAHRRLGAEVTKRTFSTEGTQRTTCSASSTSRRRGRRRTCPGPPPAGPPRRLRGGRGPGSSGPRSRRSRCSRPSSSKTRGPSAWERKSGVPPTALKARTGARHAAGDRLLRPRANSSSDRLIEPPARSPSRGR